MSTISVAAMVAVFVPIGSPKEPATSSLSLQIRQGVVTGVRLIRAGEGWDGLPAAALTGIRRTGDRTLLNDSACSRTQRTPSGPRSELTWNEETEASRVATRFSPQRDGDVMVVQRASSASPGVVGVQWGLVVPVSFEILVPGHSGMRFDKDTHHFPERFEYPIGWEAQFILVQGRRGGLLVHAEDDAERFKALHVKREADRWLIGFETRCTAPFEPVQETTSVRWRLHAYEGQWLVGAAAYRTWAAEAFGLKHIEQRQPSWVRDIRFFVISGLSPKLLEPLAKRVDPRRTMIYVPGWREDPYDRDYPDYTPRDGFAEQVARARTMGFRVMLHVNYFGVTPENPHYERMKRYHCRDPFTKQFLYWDWQRAKPPIKFAYINPAAKAWRTLFVRLMVELCKRVRPDALHLDQTLCIFNHAGGPIDGMNMMQGNLAIHRELRKALPHVALSGEGLNEITCRHEAFAQRHVYGIHHADREWNARLVALAHPVSSAMLTPHTTLYGYLGMANPEPTDYYFAWRTAYEKFGVIPTLSHPSIDQITDPHPIVRVLFEEARWFQQYRPLPDFAPGWDRQMRFRYRIAGGGRAAYRDEAYGVGLVQLSPKERTVSRRITGVSAVALPGTIPGWRAFDGERLIGLDPARSYVYIDRPRDPNVLHVRSLPEQTGVRRVSVADRHAEIALEDHVAEVCRLWDFRGTVRAGERLRDGTVNECDGCRFSSPAGTNVRPDVEGIFAHPPWRADRVPQKGSTEGGGLGTAWVEFDVMLPSERPARLETGAKLRGDRAAKESDGVTFRVSVMRRDAAESEPLRVEKHVKSDEPVPLSLDLARFQGRSVTVRLETHPGPTGNVTFDWAMWHRPRIVSARERRGTLVVAGSRPILTAVSACGEPGLRDKPASNAYTLETGLNSSTYLLFESPSEVRVPADLWRLPFDHRLVLRDGSEQEPVGFLRAKIDATTLAGTRREGLFAHPPSHGQMRIDFLLKLPDAPLRLAGFAGIRDGCDSTSNGVGFRVAVNGRDRWAENVQPDDRWVPFDILLADYAGQATVVTLVTDALGSYICDWAQWGEPRLVPAAE